MKYICVSHKPHTIGFNITRLTRKVVEISFSLLKHFHASADKDASSI